MGSCEGHDLEALAPEMVPSSQYAMASSVKAREATSPCVRAADRAPSSCWAEY